jgi:hypothetical protein
VTSFRPGPLHPQPAELESLSSWLARLARLYDMSVKDLLAEHNLDLGGVTLPYDLDYDPPAALLSALAERTGVEVTQLQTMTLAGWTPWLFDNQFIRHWDEQEVFDTYVRANCVLLAPGEARTNVIGYPKRWSGPWLGYRTRRACPVCAVEPQRATALVWRLPLVLSCAEHGCYLEPADQIEVGVMVEQPVSPRPLPEPLATVDRYTYAALTTGRVELPGRSVHAGVWFRLLRSLLDEVSLALSGRRAHTRVTLATIWAATGLPERGGLGVWRPYELLTPDLQEAMLLAAGTALHLAATDEITAYGRLASAIQPPRAQHVYHGDRPCPHHGGHHDAWAEALAQLEAAMTAARTDPDLARQLLAWLTTDCHTLTRYEEQRAYLFGAGIPADFLPCASELGRTDLT